MMPSQRRNVLFLCTGNSARSIMAEAILNLRGSGRFAAFSAGSFPTGAVNPLALEPLESRDIPTGGLSSKNWDTFAGPAAPALDIVITLCDIAACKNCPVWPGAPVSGHWGVPDPAAVEGNEAMRRAAFDAAYITLNERISALLHLPVEQLGKIELAAAIGRIGEIG